MTDCLGAIRRRRQRGETRRLRDEIRAAEARGDTAAVAAAARRLQMLLDTEPTERTPQIGAHRDHEPGKD